MDNHDNHDMHEIKSNDLWLTVIIMLMTLIAILICTECVQTEAELEDARAMISVMATEHRVPTLTPTMTPTPTPIVAMWSSETVAVIPTPTQAPKQSYYDIYMDDADMLARIAQAEAGDQGVIGMAHVVRVVMNRVESPEWPDTVYGVIHQDGQFSPVSNGRYASVKVTEQAYDAVYMVFDGWDETQGCTYFRAHTDASCWHNDELELVYSYQAHDFFRGGRE